MTAPAYAAAQTPQAGSDTVTLSLTNGTTFGYGRGTVSQFTAVVVFGTKPTANYFWTISVRLEDGETFGGAVSPTDGPDGMSLIFSRIMDQNAIPAGQHTAIASFYNLETHVTTSSNSVSFTITKANPGLSCGVAGMGHFVPTNQTLPIGMQFNDDLQVPVDWKDGTYNVSFDGPTHVTYTNLAPNTSDQVMVAAPTVIGNYVITCTFSGTSNFTAQTFTDSAHPYVFSAMHPLGTVQLFSNPTTLIAGRSTDFEVVFHAASGLPIPTGEFVFYIGQYSTPYITLNASGDMLVQLSPIQSMSGIQRITVQYFGDMYYRAQATNFPLTNPPIPGNTGSGGTGSGGSGGSTGSNPQATATSAATPGATVTSAVNAGDATPTAVGVGGSVSAGHSQPGNSSGIPLVPVLALLALVGIGLITGVSIFLFRRSQTSTGVGFQTPEIYSAPTSPPYDDRYPVGPGEW